MKLEQISEGIRFGGMERRILDKQSRDIIIGIEYEFHVDEEHRGEVAEPDEAENEERYDWVHDRAAELTQEDIDSDIKQKRDEYVSNDMSEYNVEDITRHIKDIKIGYGNVEIPVELLDLDDVIATAQSMEDGEDVSEEDKKAYDEVVEMIKVVKIRLLGLHGIIDNLDTESDHLGSIMHYVDGFGDIQNDITEFLDDINELKDLVEINSESIADLDELLFDRITDSLKFYTDLDGDDNVWDSEIEDGFKESFNDEIEVFLGYDPKNVMEHEYWDTNYETASSDWDNEHETEDTATDIVAAVEELLTSDGLADDEIIERVEEENDDTVEVITRPLKMDDAFDYMKVMLDFITYYGSTTERTGMHVNMSIRGLNFDKNEFNQMKLLMLADADYMQSLGKYPPRQHVKKMFASIESRHMIILANTYIKHGIDEVATQLEALGNIRIKHQAINFGGVSHSRESVRRIEFRYFGGEGYEEDFDDLKEDIQQAAWALLVAYSPTFANKEYYKALLKQLDKLTIKHMKNEKVSSFIGLVQKLKSGKIDVESYDSGYDDFKFQQLDLPNFS